MHNFCIVQFSHSFCLSSVISFASHDFHLEPVLLICITSQELTFVAFCTSEIGSRGWEWDAYTNSIKNIAAYSSFFNLQKCRWDICFVHLSSILLPYHKVSYIMEHSQSMWTKKCILDYNTNGVCISKKWSTTLWRPPLVFHVSFRYI